MKHSKFYFSFYFLAFLFVLIFFFNGSLLASPANNQQKTFVRVQDKENKIQTIGIEDYVLRVLASEMPVKSPLEALKAQAVVIRSFAKASLGRHQMQGFDFCHLTHCQVYRKPKYIHPKLREAIKQSRGLVLSYQGKTIEALYHSTCGGHTSPNQKVFGGRPLSYLQGVNDQDFCEVSPHFHWESKVSYAELNDIFFPHSSFQSQPVSLQMGSIHREVQGRWFELKILGLNSLNISAQNFLLQIGRKLSWSRLKSAWFEIKVKKEGLVFKGKGLGHGVGMCQWGAIGRAQAGKNFKEILYHYFPGTQLMRN